MKVTEVETLRLGEFANLIWVRIHTDEGVTGLGETFSEPPRWRHMCMTGVRHGL